MHAMQPVTVDQTIDAIMVYADNFADAHEAGDIADANLTRRVLRAVLRKALATERERFAAELLNDAFLSVDTRQGGFYLSVQFKTLAAAKRARALLKTPAESARPHCEESLASRALPAWATKADAVALAIAEKLAPKIATVAVQSGDPGRVYAIVLGMLMGNASQIMGGANAAAVCERVREAALNVDRQHPEARH